MDKRRFLDPVLSKKELLKILKWINDFLEQNDIEYSAVGGTLIGTIRNKGFIPWDDDIDLCMTRENYEKLLNLKSKIQESGKYDLISVDDGSSEFPFIKIVNKEIHVEQLNIKTDSGNYLWVDIMAFDSVPANKGKREELYKNAHLLRLILESALFDPVQKKKRNKSNLVKAFLHPLLTFYGAEKIGRFLNNYAQKYRSTESEFIGGVVWGYGSKETIRRVAFEKTEIMKFEDVDIHVMSCWDEYLTNVYGNYMKLPEESRRVTHDIKAWRV